ncbi:class I SAM-dependent methyltransferase [Bacillus sp. DTU_2020_1000418_1_SI_GHA_SEK_038]|uniref:class I SAM-dependent DNA methyltransferase n=1 Tax=Bacillus sp. DTU_2020_1000418_1_SI_GHA_SEK_038 TaxID=3077585 RepID=UPI0028E421BA|nr:class I SAM-dependent methyltransferase [Bacillus sp. DTU_2020_1000418_1_SI_GHA_SEK_038]WNS74367.1 class I SAM-dependent methyltransferase [Bacillus sp. DTU_2020_1000418_1_SI_GHA_SEK_038]
MSYGKFAYLYDQLMNDVPYDKWAELVLEKAKKYEISGKKLLDLACGTAELSVRLSKIGFQVTGVDLSEEMLTVAQDKAADNGFAMEFFHQNMAELDGLGSFDIIGIFCDSINYLREEKDVQSTFQQVYRHLSNDGLFIFDVHSLYKIQEIFMDQTFAVNDEEISYIWHCFEGEYPYSIEHDLSFFVLDKKTDMYARYDELHFQRTYPIDVYEKWLQETGFELLEVTADFENAPPQDQSERIFFICRKTSRK